MPPQCSRRRALRLSGVALSMAVSGCTSSTDYPTLRLETDEVPVDFADVSATVVRQFDDVTPAEIRVEFTNATDAEREFGFSASPPFSGLNGRTEGRDAFALLAPLESEVHVHAFMEGNPPASAVVPDRPTDGCWQAAADINAHPVAVPRRLEPGETLAETYALLAAPVGEESCPLRGEFRFESNSYFEDDWWGFSAILD